MRVTCPACQAAYEVPDEKLVAGKRLRCAQCGKEWQPPVAAPAAAEVATPAPAVVAPFQLDRPARVGTERKTPALAVGTTRGSIHQVGAAVQNAPSCNGWTFWHIELEGKLVSIDTLRVTARTPLS